MIPNLRCDTCGNPATKSVIDKKEVNGGHVAGREDLPPMIHHQHLPPAGVCDEHVREPKLIRDEELHKVRAAWASKAASVPA